MKKIIFLFVAIVSLMACSQNDSDEQPEKMVKWYIELLKSNQYNAMELPAFNHSHISELIKYVDAEQKIKDFPANPISSMYVGEIRLGLYVAWTIESIRKVAIGSDDLIGRFPSLVPGLKERNPHEFITVSDATSHPIVAQAYRDWWEVNKSKPFDEYKTIDPLIITPYQWH